MYFFIVINNISTMSKTKSKKTNKNKSQKSSGKKDLNNVKAILESYGGFHDLETFRNETGLDDHDINDMQAMQLINEDMREQKRISDVNMNQLQSKAREADSLRQARDAFSAQKTLLETNLETEKLKRQAYENLNSYSMPIVLNRYRVEPTYKLDPYKIDPYNIYDTTRYLEKERFKNELKQELQEEKRRQQEDKKWKKQIEQFNKPPRTKSRTKSKSKGKKTKGKKTKSKKKN